MPHLTGLTAFIILTIILYAKISLHTFSNIKFPFYCIMLFSVHFVN